MAEILELGAIQSKIQSGQLPRALNEARALKQDPPPFVISESDFFKSPPNLRTFEYIQVQGVSTREIGNMVRAAVYVIGRYGELGEVFEPEQTLSGKAETEIEVGVYPKTPTKLIEKKSGPISEGTPFSFDGFFKAFRRYAEQVEKEKAGSPA